VERARREEERENRVSMEREMGTNGKEGDGRKGKGEKKKG